MKSHVLGLFALLLAAAVVASAPARAQNGTLTRSFVSSAGLDSNPCSIAQPCATFAHAYTMIGANGIIAALDPGKYGPITISGPVTINGNGWAAITGPSGNNAITVNANTGDVVKLIGLEIDGANAAYNGVVFNFGGSLTVTNCSIQNFTNSGVAMYPTTGTFIFAITDTTSSNNGFDGIEYVPTGTPTVRGVIEHVFSNDNTDEGVRLDSSGTTGGSSIVTVSNSVLTNNEFGLDATGGIGPLEVIVSDSHLDNNTEAGSLTSGTGGPSSVFFKNVTMNQSPTGIRVDTNSTVYFSQTVIANNATGFSSATGVSFTGGTAKSDDTNHLAPYSGGTPGTWAEQ